MNQREWNFVFHYLAGKPGVVGNAKRSAIAAGYTARSAEVTGSRLLRKAKVAAEIAKRRNKAAKKVDKRVQEWSELVPSAQGCLKEIAGDPKKAAEPGANNRIAASNSILDRALGRPKTPVHHTIRNVDALLDELDSDDDGGQ